MSLSIVRMQEIMVDAELGRSRDGYSVEEQVFRDRVDAELAAARDRGERLEFTSVLPGDPPPGHR